MIGGSDLDVLGILDEVIPQGPSASADAGMVTTPPVYAVDATARVVQVGVRGTAMWLPAVAGRYRVRSGAYGTTGLARVLMNVVTGRPELVLGPVDPRDPAVPGTLTAINTTTKISTVTVDGASYSLPYLASTYTVAGAVWVGLSDWGVPYLVLGPSDVAAPAASTPVVPTSGSTVQVQQTITPQWSGSWRTSRAAWDRWNTDRYGGRSTLYQGDGFGSGPMKGLAVYGDQLVNLGAISIDRVRVRLRSVGLSGASGPATVQGSPHGTPPAGAPSSSGSTASGAEWADLPADVREAMRTGSVKGLATVGANYWAVAGAGNGDGMALDVLYTRRA